jgi:hypothetical protein
VQYATSDRSKNDQPSNDHAAKDTPTGEIGKIVLIGARTIVLSLQSSAVLKRDHRGEFRHE